MWSSSSLSSCLGSEKTPRKGAPACPRSPAACSPTTRRAGSWCAEQDAPFWTAITPLNDVACIERNDDVHIRVLLAAAACMFLPSATAAQGLSGALIGTVRDAQG